MRSLKWCNSPDEETLPPPLMTSEIGSFAWHTIAERTPQIIASVASDNDYPNSIVKDLEALRDEVSEATIQPLGEEAPDRSFWQQQWALFQGRTWLDLPWYFAETYFYRRLLEAVRYFQPGAWQGVDPFEEQKQRDLEGEEGEGGAIHTVTNAWQRVAEANWSDREIFTLWLHYSLWGNRADLSNIVLSATTKEGFHLQKERANLLIDDTEQVWSAVMSGSLRRIDFINDNTGLELLFDLCLADLLLTDGWTDEVHFHLKAWPFFVSDAMVKDVTRVLEALAHTSGPAHELAERLRAHTTAGRMVFKAEDFWTTSLFFWEMSEELYNQLSRADLVILKGDVNYRRLLGDRCWPHTTSMAQVTAYFPTSFVTLRTLKGEIIVGLAPGQAEALASQDSTWLTNGKRGVIQFVAIGT